MSIVVGGALVTLGVLLILITAVGLLRMPDVYSRMHGAAKTTSLGLGTTLVGAGVLHGEVGVAAKLVLAVLFLLLTQPVAVHLMARAAHSAGVPLWEGTHWDELRNGPPPERRGRSEPTADDLP